MDASIKVNRTLSKTVVAADEAALDIAYATFVQTLGEDQLVSVTFMLDGANWVVNIIYIPA